MITNGNSISRGHKCHDIKLPMGNHYFDYLLYYIPLGCTYLVLYVQWRKQLRTLSVNIQVMILCFTTKDNTYHLEDLASPPSQINSSHQMEKLVNKGATSVVAQLYSSKFDEEPQVIHEKL
jgi:hypothetical protein